MNDQAPHRFPWRVTAVIVAVVVVASVVAGVMLSRQRVETATAEDASVFTPAPQALPLVEQRQLTLLLTVRDADRVAVSSALVGVGGDTGFVAELLLPRDLLLPTTPPIRLEQATDPTGGQTADQPLETLLGVQVDAVLDLDRLAWTGLIDATGAPVSPTAADNPVSFPLILDAVLAGLPDDRTRVAELLTGLGSMARTNVTNEDATYLLTEVGRGVRAQEVRRESLPVVYLRSGIDRVAVAQTAPTAEVVGRLFPGALLQPGHPGQVRVVLQRAGASLGASVEARLQLVDDGFGVLDDRSPLPPATSTVVWVPANTEAALEAGRQVAQSLSLPASVVRVDPEPSAMVDVRIVLGSDWRLV